MNLRFLILFIIVILVTISCDNSSELPEELQQCIQKVAQNNTYGDPNIRVDWSVKTPNEHFEILLKKLSKNQIIQFTRYKNPAIRAYAYKELIERKDEELPIIFKKLINDRSRIDVRHSDVIMEDPLYSIFYHEVANANVVLSNNQSDSLFYNELLLKLNEIVINSDIKEKNDLDNWLILYRALNGKNDYSKYYKQIRKRAIKYGEKEALKALARFNKPEDNRAIIKWKDRAFPAIAENPKPYFWQLLVDEFDNVKYGKLGSDEFDIREYIRAISSYQNDNAANLLNNIYLRLKILYTDYELEQQIINMHEILIEFKCKPFDDLCNKISEEYKTVVNE